MLEITEKDIANLEDADLRDLIARLAAGEFRSKGLPRSSVTAGGNQDAADGGIDVRVDCPKKIKDPDFVPRPQTGFQVKKPDMRRGAILEEMCPKGVLRGAIRELADVSGAYLPWRSLGAWFFRSGQALIQIRVFLCWAGASTCLGDMLMTTAASRRFSCRCSMPLRTSGNLSVDCGNGCIRKGGADHWQTS